MLRPLTGPLWAFDAEWIPDPRAGRLLYKLPAETDEAEVMAEMWRQGGATTENPRPYLKTALCRLVSVAAVVRTQDRNGQPTITMASLPNPPHDVARHSEREVVERFLHALGRDKPVLVGFNSLAADIRILVQRGVILGLRAADFCARPRKPWEGVDYLARGSDWNIDLRDLLSPGFGPGTPSLHEMAVQCGIPGKMDVDGQQVPDLWLAGRLNKIVSYNEFDALTTYLLWLRLAHFSGLFSTAQYEVEQQAVEAFLIHEGEREGGRPHFLEYRRAWEQLRVAGV
ncbi:MAG: hypothetical protein HQL56_16290 [Magnetococcales bacterium]|nr:hypothetical protein [Magnetococcales bacterium]